jgi:hypothetical protein
MSIPSNKPKLISTTIQDYCILGTSIVAFMVLEFWEGCFADRGIALKK